MEVAIGYRLWRWPLATGYRGVHWLQIIEVAIGYRLQRWPLATGYEGGH